MKKSVALVLGSGGARGLAHIGAIAELEARGYSISSIAGTSMGALVGGLYAQNCLQAATDWLLSLTWKDKLALIDFTLSSNAVVKGERIIAALNRLAPDTRIEHLPLPFRAIAADLRHNREVIFDRGSLYAAIRSSIAIPSFFSPLETKKMFLVDGGVINPLPLNRIVRKPSDLLIAINVFGAFEEKTDQEQEREDSEMATPLWKFWKRHKSLNKQAALNSFSMMARCTAMMTHRLTTQALQITPPDLLVEIPSNRYGLFDYEQAATIIEDGRRTMHQALDAYEAAAI